MKSKLNYILRNYPDAVAHIKGSEDYPEIKARVEFYIVRDGVLVYTEAGNLPTSENKPFRVFAYHIHEGKQCAGDAEDPFADAKSHYNPTDEDHPYHAGDLPPLFSNYGYAWNIVLTSRFNLNDVIGRTIIIHLNPDDFTTQPSGDSGPKIACGIIERYHFRR